jgi:hypothetical protein
MTPDRLSTAAFFLLVAVISILLARTARVVTKRGDSAAAVFYLFALISIVVNDLYWIAYDMLRPEVRMPFAANEFGEAAFYLLFGSAVTALFRDRSRGRTEGICAVIFAFASAGLWIAWSGEWIQDLMAAPVHAYFLYVTAVSLKQADALAPREWNALGAASLLLIIMQTAIFFVPAGLKKPLDQACYLLMFLVQAALMLRAGRAVRGAASPKTQLALSLAAFAWSVSTVYMSEGYWYVAGLLCEAFSMICIQISFEREVLR